MVLLAVKNEEQVHDQAPGRIIRPPAYMETRAVSSEAQRAQEEARTIRERLARGTLEKHAEAEATQLRNAFMRGLVSDVQTAMLRLNFLDLVASGNLDPAYIVNELARLDAIAERGVKSEDHVYRGRVYGVVLAVGEPPHKFDRRGRWLADAIPPPTELEFGDVVELSHYWEGYFRKNPLQWLWGETGEDAVRLFAPEDGGPESYPVTNAHILAFLYPADIICRWSRREWNYHDRGEEPAPRPIGDRIMIRNCKPPERTAGGIYMPHLNRRTEPYGRVVAVGRDVRDLMAGDWALIRQDRGTRIDIGDDTFTIVRNSAADDRLKDVLGRWDDEPGEMEKLRYCAELNS